LLLPALPALAVVTVSGVMLWVLCGALGNNRGQLQWVVLPHAVQLFVQNSKYSEATIKQGMTTNSTSTQYRRATAAELAWLKQQGAVDTRTTIICLVSLQRCLKVGKDHGVPASILSQLAQQPQAVPLAAAAAPTLADQGPASLPQGAPSPQQLQHNTTAAAIQPVCPDTVPVWQGEPPQGQYGLSTLQSAKGEVLNTAMGWLQQLQQWSTSPIRLSRPRETQMLAASSWAGVQGEVLRFLGFAHLHRGVEQPTLHHYLNGFLLVDFISFLQARGVQPQNLADAVHQAERAVTFLAHTNRLSLADMQLLPSYRGWLANLAWQLGSNLVPAPRPTLSEQLQQGTWMEPQDLMLCLHQVMEAATAVEHKVGISLSASIQNMQAALCCSMFGWVPPLRPSVLISLQHPDYKGPCLHPDCQHPLKCKGNRVEVLEPEADSTDTDTTSSNCSFHSAASCSSQVRLVAPHHKVSRYWGRGPIDCELPPELADLYQAHYKGGWELVVQLAQSDKADSRYFFLQAHKGQQLLPQQASQIFAKVVLPASSRFGAQKARGIFVTAARDKQLGELDEGAAAVVMGNSLSVWEQVYDRSRVSRSAAKNVAALAQWRQGVLAAARGAAAPRGVGAAGALPAAAAATGAGAAAPTSATEAAAAVIGVQREYVDLTMDLD
jgi:hypothetical protein